MIKVRKILILADVFVFVVFALYMLNHWSKNYLVQLHNLDELNSIIDGVIYFGRPSCPECKIYEPILFDIAKDENKHIYYFNTDYFRQNNILPEDQLQALFKEYQVDNVPMIIHLKNGETVGAFHVYDAMSDISSIMEQTRNFIGGDFPRQYIPQYTIIIILFAIAAMLLHIHIFYETISNYLSLALAAINVGSVIILIYSVKSIMNYIDVYHLSGDIRISALLYITLATNIASLGRLTLCRQISLNKTKL